MLGYFAATTNILVSKYPVTPADAMLFSIKPCQYLRKVQISLSVSQVISISSDINV